MWDLVAATRLVILLKLESNHWFSACMTLKLHGWSRKTIWYLFYATSSFVHNYKAPGNSNWSHSPEMLISCQNLRFLSHVTLQFDVRPWKIMGHIFYVTSSFVHHFVANDQYSLETLNSVENMRLIVPCGLEIWRMALEYNRVPLLCYFKLCVACHSHRWIKTRGTVRKRPNRTNIADFAARVPLQLYTDISSDNGNNSWYFMMTRSWEHSENLWQKERRTYGQADGLNHS